jgi:alkylation response protein AidB-like acyl-CoA dehydrogenase
MTTTGEGPVARARAIAPIVAAESEAIHRGGRLTPAAHGALVGADLFRACAPADVGGDACSLRDATEVAVTLGAADVSTGWLFVQANASAYNFGARLDRATARDVFADASSVIAAGFPVGAPRADRVEGGYVVGGEWAFASGCLHASWFDARAIVYERGERVTTRSGLFAMTSCLVPRDAVTITDTWDVAGMRGTGSRTYSMTDTFVPAARTLPMWEMAPPEAGPAFRIPALTHAHVQFAGLALGGARGALAAFRELASDKRAAQSRAPMREMATTHLALGRAHAALRAAGTYLDWVIGLLQDAAAGSAGVTHDERAESRLAVTTIMETALTVVEDLYRVAGTSGIFASSPLHRAFQDLHVMSQQLFARPAHVENVGRYLLGLEHDRSLL